MQRTSIPKLLDPIRNPHPFEKPLSCRHFPENDPQGIDIGVRSYIQPLPFDLFGGHIFNSPDQRPRFRFIRITHDRFPKCRSR